jgi:hypothetical protein
MKGRDDQGAGDQERFFASIASRPGPSADASTKFSELGVIAEGEILAQARFAMGKSV